MHPCRVCQQSTELLLDFGPQPLCNRFLAEPSAAETRHRLRLGQCTACGLLQLIEPVAAAAVTPPAPVYYHEPEWHLDEVVSQITALRGVTRDGWICGATYKDASVIDRLRRRGYANAICLDARGDWGIADPAAGVETLQERISDGVPKNRPAHSGRYQVVIARHVLEHAHSQGRFVDGLRSLLAPGGWIIFEVPDFTASLQSGNYSSIWEEHVTYLTKTTFPDVLQRLGLEVRETLTFPSASESLLIGITQVAEKPHESRLDRSIDGQLAQGRLYASMLPAVRTAWRRTLSQEIAAAQPVAILGAGHTTIMFLNLLELQDMVDFVVDDDPAKCGWYLPGSRLPVCGTDTLCKRSARLCLMSVSPENEGSVRQRHHRYLESGGRFASIFPTSQAALVPRHGL